MQLFKHLNKKSEAYKGNINKESFNVAEQILSVNKYSKTNPMT